MSMIPTMMASSAATADALSTALPLRRPAVLRRSWLFVPGLAGERQHAGLESGADVLVADLEEFTAPADRPAARRDIVAFLAQCRARHIIGAVRINKLAQDGHADLDAVMAGRPDAILLPFAETAAQIAALDAAIAAAEHRHGVPVGSTEIVPTLESARGIVRAQDILAASPRVSACLLAAEDLSQDLGLERGPDGIELHAVRARFVVDCAAAGCLAIDCPFNYDDAAALALDLTWARRVGFRSKCATLAAQVAVIHEAYTPAGASLAQARSMVAAYEARQQGSVAGAMVATPDYNTARRALRRAAEFDAWTAALGQAVPTPGELN